jgi:hypothetical protein
MGDDLPYKAPNILRLTGIRMADYVPVEDVADAILMDGGTDNLVDVPAPESIMPPDKIPRTFSGLEDWPMHSNLKCWMCDHTFDDRPKFVPTHVREGENGGIEFGVKGNFCTFNCAELWILTHLGGRAGNKERWGTQDGLCLVYFMFTGRRVSRIKPAINKTELRQYGGEMDPDVFSRKMRELDPIAGLKDHTLGSIIPERDRPQTALSILKARTSGAVSTTAREIKSARNLGGVWSVCGQTKPEPSDSVGLGPDCETAPDTVGAVSDEIDADLAKLLRDTNGIDDGDIDQMLDFGESTAPEANVAPTKVKTSITVPSIKIVPATEPATKAAPPATKAASPATKTGPPATKAAPQVVTTKTAPPATKAAPQAVTTKTASQAVTTKTAPQVAGTKTTPQVAGTKAGSAANCDQSKAPPSAASREGSDRASHQRPTVKTASPVTKAAPPIVKTAAPVTKAAPTTRAAPPAVKTTVAATKTAKKAAVSVVSDEMDDILRELDEL